MHRSAAQPVPADLHDDQVVALLRSGAHAALLSAYFGDLEYRELAQLARLAATRHNRRGHPVLILPGIMGSRLGSIRRHVTNLLWLHPSALAEGGLAQLALPATKRLRAVGVMLPGYLKLKLTLEVAGFRPQFHAFDWRADLDRLARTLVQTIDKSAQDRVSIIAHSMGGLIARLALRHDKHRRIRRIVQLGAPNAGSFAPVQAFRAAYPTVRKLAALDQKHSAEDLAREVFHTLPGLYQLLPTPLHATEPDLFDARSWPQDDLVPDVALLQRARRVRERLPAADDRCCSIVGVNQETVVALRVRDGVFEYTVQADGDGTVPRVRAIWPDAANWFAAENHGALTTNSTVIGALCDLLKSGDTSRLSTSAPPAAPGTRIVSDAQLRTLAPAKVHWDALSVDSRRRILEPVISPEFKRSPG